MKKQMIMLALAGALVLAGCGNKENKTSQSELTGEQTLSTT